MELTFEQKHRINRAAGATDYSQQIIHYTSEQSLSAILGSNELWFGRIDQMNDAAEYNHFFYALQHLIPELFSLTSHDQLFSLAHMLDRLIRDRAYISSWCEYHPSNPEGSLHMWTRYGDGGRGVAAVVDSSDFQPSALTNRKFKFFVHSSQVTYLRQSNARTTAEELIEKIRQVGVPMIDSAEEAFLLAALVAKAPTTKHHSFHEEKEIRFLIMPGFSESAQIAVPQNRLRRLGQREFFSLPLENWTEFEFDLQLSSLLKKVLIGPLDNPIQRKARTESLLEQSGLGHVDVEIVDIPLRE